MQTRVTARHDGTPAGVLERLLSQEPGRILSVFISSLRDFDLAEDVLDVL